jgi:hypothetical protein
MIDPNTTWEVKAFITTPEITKRSQFFQGHTAEELDQLAEPLLKIADLKYKEIGSNLFAAALAKRDQDSFDVEYYCTLAAKAEVDAGIILSE